MSGRHVTDGGLETDLIFNRGVDLPGFAAFPLLDSTEGREHLRDYYTAFADIARRADAPLLLETPTWCANPDRAADVGYDAADLDRINTQAVEFLRDLARDQDGLDAWEIGGVIGPRGDGYRSDGPVDPTEAADYHRPQLASFAAAGAGRATALTITEVGEAIGIARAAAEVGIPAAIGFTVETDGRLPDGTSLRDAVEAVDTDTPPGYFVVNCAHPTHVLRGLDAGAWRERVGGLRVNASTMSHAELDQSDTLDDGDPQQLAVDQQPLLAAFPAVQVLGGCCGTDARHVAAMFGL